jgi:hypothetical protein
MKLRSAHGPVRPAAVAGMFYEGRAETLQRIVDGMLREAGPREPTAMTGVVVPHAGHIYSGPVAASAYRLLPVSVRRVLLIGPSHFVPLRALASSSAVAWQTPLGDVPLDRDEIDRLVAQFPRDALMDDAAHASEHCLEVQLPFLQRVLQPGWRLVPFVVGHLGASEVADVIAASLAAEGTLLVVSTDLSHYLPYERAASRDRATADRVAALQPGLIGDDDACGAYALRGALQYAAGHGAQVRVLDLRSSGDTAGPRDRVVGYGAFLIGPAGDRRGRMLALARRTIEEALRTGRHSVPTPPALDEDLREEGASFVTLRSASTGELLGCIGSLEAYRPLGVDVASHALDAAFHDPRFGALTARQAQDMRIDISVLGPLEEFACDGYQDLVARAPVGKGLFITAGGYRATFLPQVWQELPQPAQFVAALWRKAGLVEGTWPQGISVATYEVEEFGE